MLSIIPYPLAFPSSLKFLSKMVGLYHYDKTRVLTIVQLTCESFGAGRAPSTKRAVTKLKSACRKLFGKKPSELFVKVRDQASKLRDLSISLAPTAAGTLPVVACPNGWQVERFSSFTENIVSKLASCADNLLHRRASLLRQAHERGVTAIRPRAQRFCKVSG